MDTIQENEIFNLADKVDYQDGAFHPLVIDSNDKAEHVLMAVDKGVLIPDHKAPSDLIFQAVGGKDLNVKKGDFLYLKEGTLHHLQAVSKFKFSMVRLYK